MVFRVEFTVRANRDLAAIYSFIDAGHSEAAFTWFLGLETMIHSLREQPGRGMHIEDLPEHRQLHYGSMPHVYRILYRVDAPAKVVHIVHIRHGARAGYGMRSG